VDRKFKAIAFDLDGTLIDTEPLYRRITAETILRKLDHQITDDDYNKYWLGRTTTDGLIGLLTMLRGTAPTDSELNDIVATYREIAATMRLQYDFELFDGVLDALHWCKDNNIPVAIVTSTSRTTLEQQAAKYHLDVLNDFIDHWVTRLDVAKTKPDPEPYQKAIGLLEVSPDDLLVVEDTTPGIISGKAAGAATVIVNSLDQNGADYRFATMRELADHLPEFFV
jgi:beta-phosphoglucomutase-like phosphatase (HAD superfamily)